MDLGAWPLRVSVAEAQDLFETQIAAGEHLLGQIAAAAGLADLAPVREDLSVWSARNEAVFARTFGATAGQQHRLGTGAAVAVHGFDQRRAEITRHVQAALGKLRRAAAVLDLVPGGVPPTVSSSVPQPVAATGAVQDGELPASEVVDSSSLQREPSRLPGNAGTTGSASKQQRDRVARAGENEVPPAHGRRTASVRQPGAGRKGEKHRDQAIRAAHVGGIYVIAATVIGAILGAIFTNGFGLFAARDHGVAGSPSGSSPRAVSPNKDAPTPVAKILEPAPNAVVKPCTTVTFKITGVPAGKAFVLGIYIPQHNAWHFTDDGLAKLGLNVWSKTQSLGDKTYGKGAPFVIGVYIMSKSEFDALSQNETTYWDSPTPPQDATRLAKVSVVRNTYDLSC
jgi:hypothetical protein